MPHVLFRLAHVLFWRILTCKWDLDKKCSTHDGQPNIDGPNIPSRWKASAAADNKILAAIWLPDGV
jgi:hypothetical protein